MYFITQLGLIFVFLVLSIFTFSYPGLGIIRLLKIKLSNLLEEYVLSTVVGVCIFTLSAYFLAAVNLRLLMWIYPLVGLILFFTFRKIISDFKIKVSREILIWFLLIFILGILSQVAVNAFSGVIHPDGIYFYSSHGHDGVWHLSLMDEMKKNIFPFQNPEYGGHRLQNYHFFVDLFMSEISRLYSFSNLDVYFRLVPTLFSILIQLSAFILVMKWSGRVVASLWSMFFITFAGSFGYLVTLTRSFNLNGSESVFWVSQTQSVLGNPPHASAFIIMITFLFVFFHYLINRRWGFFALCVLFGGSIIEFKVYAGIIILCGLFTAAILELIIRKNIRLVLLFLTTLILALIIYLPNSINSQEFLIWQPWWFIRTMVVAPDRLNWLDLELRRQTYVADHNYKRVVQLETIAFLIFLFGNLGLKFVGFLQIFKVIKQNIFNSTFNLVFLVMTLLSFAVPVFFLQKGVAWNTIQFNQYFLLLFGFFAAVTLSDLQQVIRWKLAKYAVIFLIIILAVPTQVGLLWQFYSNRPLSKVSTQSLKALSYLKDNSQLSDVVLTAPFDKYKASKFYPPIPIYTWYDTGYVSAFSSRNTFLADEEQVKIMGYDIDSVLKEREQAFNDLSSKSMLNLIQKYHLKFIYLEDDQNFKADTKNLGLELIYNKDKIKVYKTREL